MLDVTTQNENDLKCDAKFQLVAPKSKTGTACEEAERFLDVFCEHINRMGLPHETTNTLYSMSAELIKNITILNKSLISDDNGLQPADAIDMTDNFFCDILSKNCTTYKRNKMYDEMETCVAPEELMLGVRWNMVRLKDKNVAVPRFLPCKFEYIPIIRTLGALLKRDDFRNEFFKPKHQCVEGVYEDFCCGSVFQNNTPFRSSENCIQIQLATDDFEVANPLGSKATLHKMCPIYLSFRNMSHKSRSRVDNIYLLSLCNSDDIKTEYTDFNDLWRIVVHEIAQLEEGVQIDEFTIYGTISNLVHDNLGANSCLGLVENFSKTNYSCRVCLCDKLQRKTLCIEIPELNRTK